MPEDDAIRDHKDNILVRLRHIEGQMRGLQKMIEEGRPCADVVTQISAATGAMKRITAIMVACSMRQAIQMCATDSVEAERELDKLMDAFSKMA